MVLGEEKSASSFVGNGSNLRSGDLRDLSRGVLNVAFDLLCHLGAFCKVDSGAIQSPLRHRLQFLQLSLFGVEFARSS